MSYTPVWPMTLVWLFFRLVMTLGDVVKAGRDAPRREQARRGAADIQPLPHRVLNIGH